MNSNGINKNWVFLLLVIVSIVGCHSFVSFYSEVTYFYVNQSGVDLVIEAYDNETSENKLLGHWKVHHGEMVSIGPLYGETSSSPFFGFGERTKNYSYFVVIKFDDGRCLTYKRYDDSSSKNIFELRSYPEYVKRLRKNPKKNESPYISGRFNLTWIFTPEDVAQAVDCDML